MMQVTKVEELAPLARPESTTRAATETAQMVTMLRSLDDADWSQPTDCPDWDVRAMAAHVLGMAETFSSLRRFARDMRAGGKAAGDGPFIDGLTAVQVRDRTELSSDELIRQLAAAGPRQAQWRASRRLMRRIPMKQEMPDGSTETWKASYLFDTILTRDTWMHRVDIARATGRPLVLTADHDGRLVGDVVAEWARRHGQPFTLHLEGPAGGTYAHRTGGEDITLDAVEFCRILSGRATGDGLLSQQVPF
ncbi:MAG TPA: maleylpyruvate isomerase family mycothiol-dependent enzyme [Acidimicrobiales bacterium]|nr:maleylpyruvate isomerase family mycothiol-dependent enzyme [Acidimicrobiales bacterium]